MNSNQLNALLEALNFSPDNIPLRNHVAELLYQQQDFSEAEKHFKIVLQGQPDNQVAKFHLAGCFYGLKKYSSAIIILEELLDAGQKSAEIMRLYSKCLLEDGAIKQAMEAYQEALLMDPAAVDDTLEKRLKQPAQSEGGDDTDHAGTGRVAVEKPTTSFKDVGGLDQVKNEIDLKIIKPLLH